MDFTATITTSCNFYEYECQWKCKPAYVSLNEANVPKHEIGSRKTDGTQII